MNAAAQQPPPYRLDPCPVHERVRQTTALGGAYKPQTRRTRDSEENIEGADGVTRQRCGGGYRILKKRIGGQ